MERSTIFKFGKPSISIRAIYTVAMLVISRGYWFYTLDTNYLMALSRVAPEMEDQWINQPMAKSPGLSRWLSEDKKLSSDGDDWVTNTYASNPLYSPEFSVIREVDISLKILE